MQSLYGRDSAIELKMTCRCHMAPVMIIPVVIVTALLMNNSWA